jgi:hypothetical protein
MDTPGGGGWPGRGVVTLPTASMLGVTFVVHVLMHARHLHP